MFGGFGSNTFGTTKPAQTGFGQTAQVPTAGTLFGATATAAPAFGTQPATGPALFGQPAQNTNSLFGSTSTSAPLFGTTPATTTAAPFGGFTVTTTAAPPALGTSMFGSQPQPSLFGTAQPQQTNPLFGTAPQMPFGTSMFQPQQIAQQPAVPRFWDQLMQIKNLMNPQHPQCQFKHFLYNMVHPDEVSRYTKPPNVDDSLWNQAQIDNPEPSCMVPVLAVGFDDLQKRMEEQKKQSSLHQLRLNELTNSLDTLFKKHQLETLVKMEEYKRRQAKLIQRVLNVMVKVHVLRNKGYTIRAEEEAIKAKLQDLLIQIQKPTIFKGRINELSAQLQQFVEIGKTSPQYEIVDERAVKAIYQTLSELQNGIQSLLEISSKNKKELVSLSQTSHTIKLK